MTKKAVAKLVSSPLVTKHEGGFDRDLFDPKQDSLDRWHLAESIFDIIQTTPADWSVRIGIYGEWGSGKTTVMNFIAKEAEKNKYPFIRFNPWSYLTHGQMWIGLSEAILDGLQRQGFKAELVDKGRKSLAKYAPKIELAAAKAGELADDIENPLYKLLAKTAASGISVLSSVFGIDGDFISQLRKELGDKKIIVAIDDLDRTDPKLIPQLLLTLREILDLPGFSFLLAIDRDKVAKAIAHDHPSWGTGHEFLEKIIDFPFYIPETTQAQRSKLFRLTLQEQCDFLDQKYVAAIEEHLPSNPRKIKLVIRNLRTLKSEIGRHDSEELDWGTIFISAIIKAESPQLLDKIKQRILEATGLLEWSAYSLDEKKNEEKRDKFVAELLSDIADVDKDKRERLKALLFALFPEAAFYRKTQILYNVNLIIQPHRITWKEFKVPFGRFTQSSDIKKIDEWIREQSSRRNVPCEEVASEFYESAVNFYSGRLESASGADYLDRHAEIIEESIQVLQLIEALFLQGVDCVGNDYFKSLPRIKMLLDVVMTWPHFNTNPMDKKIRKLEGAALQAIVSSGFDDVVGLYEMLFKRNHESAVFEKSESSKALFERLTKSIELQVAEKVLALFSKDKSIIALHADGQGEVFKYFLLNPTSCLFKRDIFAKIRALSKASNTDPIIQNNLREYLSLITRKIARGSWHVKEVEVQQTAKNEVLIKMLWRAAIKRRLQFRMLQEFRQERARLIAAGAQESWLPQPKWMLQGKERFAESQAVEENEMAD